MGEKREDAIARHAAADAWFALPTTQKLCDHYSLVDQRGAEFLRNRLAAAFLAGWTAREQKERDGGLP